MPTTAVLWLCLKIAIQGSAQEYLSDGINCCVVCYIRVYFKWISETRKNSTGRISCGRILKGIGLFGHRWPVWAVQCLYTYQHSQVLSCLALQLSDLLAEVAAFMLVREQVTVPFPLIMISYCPDIVNHNVISNSVAMLELTCPLHSPSIWKQQGIVNNLSRDIFDLSKFDRLKISSNYDNIEYINIASQDC